jgi:hypothetical protein
MKKISIICILLDFQNDFLTARSHTKHATAAAAEWQMPKVSSQFNFTCRRPTEFPQQKIVSIKQQQ